MNKNMLPMLSGILIALSVSTIKSYAYTYIDVYGNYAEWDDPVIAEIQSETEEIPEDDTEDDTEEYIYSDIMSDMTYEQIRHFENILEAEAGNQGLEGSMMVVEVIFNRVLHDLYPNTVYGVLSEISGGCRQFSTWKNRNSDRAGELQSDAIAEVLAYGYPSAIDNILSQQKANGSIPEFVQATDYVYFGTSKRSEMKYAFKYRGHWFGTHR